MADGAELSFDGAAIDRTGDAIVRRYLSAGADAVRGETRALEKRLEAATQAAVPGNLYRAWQSAVFPRSGPARDPAGTIFLKGGARTRGAIAFWTQPGAIRGSRGQYLAVPLPAAGSRGRGRDLTPGEWERSHGQRLIFLYRQGKPSLLVAKGGTTNVRSGAYRPLTGKRTRAGRAGSDALNTSVVPIFILLPVVKFRNAFAIKPMIDESEGALARRFFAEVGAAG